MDVRFNLDQLIEEESLKPLITQEKIKVQEEEESTMVQEGAKEENEIILNLEENKVESKVNLEVVLPIASNTNSYAPHYPNLGIEVHITKEALLSFSMSKLRNDVIYDVFPVDAYYLFFGRPLKISPRLSFMRDPTSNSKLLLSIC